MTTPRKTTRIDGDTLKGEIEVRYDDAKRTRLDEIVAQRAYVHLEQMTDSSYALIIVSPKQQACFCISGKGITAMQSWREPVNHRSEAAKRRENAKKYGLRAQRRQEKGKKR